MTSNVHYQVCIVVLVVVVVVVAAHRRILLPVRSDTEHRKARHPLGKSTRYLKVGMASEDEQECEPIEMDNLVFDRQWYA